MKQLVKMLLRHSVNQHQGELLRVTHSFAVDRKQKYQSANWNDSFHTHLPPRFSALSPLVGVFVSGNLINCCLVVTAVSQTLLEASIVVVISIVMASRQSYQRKTATNRASFPQKAWIWQILQKIFYWYNPNPTSIILTKLLLEAKEQMSWVWYWCWISEKAKQPSESSFILRFAHFVAPVTGCPDSHVSMECSLLTHFSSAPNLWNLLYELLII